MHHCQNSKRRAMTNGSKMPGERPQRGWKVSMRGCLIWVRRAVLPEQLPCWLVSLFQLKNVGSIKLATAGLGFDESDQQRPTRSFSGGWRYDFYSRIHIYV